MSIERSTSAFIVERLAEKICSFDARSISRKALAQSRDCILEPGGRRLVGDLPATSTTRSDNRRAGPRDDGRRRRGRRGIGWGVGQGAMT